MTLPKPVATYSEDLYHYEWPDAGVEAIAERFHEAREGDVRCELTVTSSHPTQGGQLYFGSLLLKGPRSRSDVAKALEKREDGPDWGGMLEQVCTLSLRRYREGAPAVDLWSADLGTGNKYLLCPFLFDDALNMFYGAGDSGKSIFLLMLTLAIASGQEVCGLVSEREGTVLYLDWEDTAKTHQERLRGLAAGFGITLPEGRVIYRRMDASLKEAAREVRRDIASTGAVFVIVDSVGMACGGDPSDASAVIQTMLAARSLAVPVGAIHHIGKEAKDKSTPYGSVYASNEARMSWYVEAERTDGQLTVVLTNYKHNRGAQAERRSYRFLFTEDEHEVLERIGVEQIDFRESKAVGDGGQKWKIAEYLKGEGRADVAAIAHALNFPRERVRTQLNRHKELFLKFEDGSWGLLVSGRHTESTHPDTLSRGDTTQGGPLRGPSVTPETDGLEEEQENLPW